MGGGYYDYDIAADARSSNQDAFTYSGYGTDAESSVNREEVHELLNPHGASRECVNQTPIVVALDVTRSRGNDSRVMYEKLPTFIGQIELKGYVEGSAVSFCAIGDATDGDKAPVQSSQFEADNRLDEAISHFWLEEGGGGSGQESYELVAYYYAKHSKLACNESGEKGYFFFVGDEGFYPKVSKEQVKNILGQDIPTDLDSKEIFKELQEKYHVFFIYPQKSWEERKGDIDAEIRKRVEQAGGQYDNVDVRASLIWNNRNDLDVHVFAPSGEEIWYSSKRSRCNGWLDVDMNVQGETLKPVENIRWAKGQAPKGHYKVIVQNYGFHESKETPTPFKVELEINGKIQHFEGVASPNGETGAQSNITVCEFDYDPEAREVIEEDLTVYKGYDDTLILDQWKSVIPEENILLIEDPQSIIDVMLGSLALVTGSADLDSYLVDLKSRNENQLQREQTYKALEHLASNHALAKIEVGGSLPPKSAGKQRKSGTKRL
ncbi:MAG: hypothetical protein ACI86H_000691 [bacterium]|jgi:hypothetical protein